jgi:hypothetical protein
MIQIIRLKNGEDIIGQVFEDTGDYEILDPMTVDIEFRGKESGLVMKHWLPVQLIELNRTIIKKEDVLTTFYPNKDFAEYYENTVEKLAVLLEAKRVTDKMSDDELEEVMEALEQGDNQTLH